MGVQYRTDDERVEQRLSEVISKKSGGFILCYFNNAEDLLSGIDALKSFNIPILEVYSSRYIEALKTKVELKRLKAGQATLKYLCFGGVSLVSIAGYILDHNWNTTLNTKDVIGIGTTLFLMISTFVLASWLLVAKPPKIIQLLRNDARFLIVIKTKNVILDDNVASFLQYSGSVEITQAVKRMLLT